MYEQYKDDEQFKCMYEEYGSEYASSFLKDVLENELQTGQKRAGGGNNCYQHVKHAKTKYFTYYGGKNTGHYLSLDEVDRSSKKVRIVDCNYDNKYFGIHKNVSLKEAYNAVAVESGRYLIY